MKRISADAFVSITSVHSGSVNGFGGGDPTVPTNPTEVDETWLNNLQEEIATVIEEASITLNGTVFSQLSTALHDLFVDKANAQTIAGDKTFTSGTTSGKPIVATGGGGDAGLSSPNGGDAGTYTGGAADSGGTGGTGVVASGGLNGDGATYAAALHATNGNVLVDHDMAAQGFVSGVAGLTSASGSVSVGGTGSAIPHPTPTAMTLNPGGGAWAAVGSLTPKYFKDAFGIVHLEGVVNLGALTDVIATLPSGFRPPVGREFPTLVGGTSIALVTVDTSGNIASNVNGGSGGGITLDGITYRT